MNVCFIALVIAHSALAAIPTDAEFKVMRDWATPRLIDGARPSGPIAFSFTYNGNPSAEFLGDWHPANESPEEFSWTDLKSHLKVAVTYHVYTDFPVVEWTIHFKNEGSVDTPVISDIAAIDTTFTHDGDFTLYHNKGDNCVADSYAPLQDALAPNTTKHLANTGGRPTQTEFPYFNIGWPGGGVIYALSWAGQWSTDFIRDEANGLRIRGGQERTHFVLHPGEEARGPMVVLQFYEGDRMRAQNVWRAWMLAHNTPRPGGKLPPCPQLAACSSHQFGEMIHADTASQKFFIDKYLERGMKLDYWWMDAGWYLNESGWPQTGTWEVDTKRFPGGLRPISDYAHAKDVKIITWFEPERVAENTWLSNNHPEWISGGKKGGLLDLGNPEAHSWLTDHVDKLLTSEGIDLYRQDFNMDPLDAWRADEAPDRQGLREIRHVEGYFAYWDALRAKHPNMLIDSCASGGRRNDLETLRRAMPLLRSDYIMEPTGNQAQSWALASWFPFYGTGTSKTDPYQILSVLCPSFTACWDQRDEKIDWPAISKLVAAWKDFAPYFYGDYYPLTPYTLDTHDWIAWQFHDPVKNAGMIQVFRREENSAESMKIQLKALDSKATYDLTDLNMGALPSASGADLTASGLAVTLSSKPGATVVMYTAK